MTKPYALNKDSPSPSANVLLYCLVSPFWELRSLGVGAFFAVFMLLLCTGAGLAFCVGFYWWVWRAAFLWRAGAGVVFKFWP